MPSSMAERFIDALQQTEQTNDIEPLVALFTADWHVHRLRTYYDSAVFLPQSAKGPQPAHGRASRRGEGRGLAPLACSLPGYARIDSRTRVRGHDHDEPS